jgi:multiple sugar transport system substrate-binding protein
MSGRIGLTRRRMIGASIASAAGLALGTGRLDEALAARRAPAFLQASGKITYWGGLIFSDDANNLLTDTINKWGEDNGVDTEVVMINQNETTQKVSAAVESNTMPDALDLGLDLMLLLVAQNKLVALDDLYAKIGTDQGGWYEGVDTASKTAGGRFGIPFGQSGNLLLRRNDALTEKGFTEAPTTWDELVTQAVAVQDPPLYGLGLALSNVGDGNVQVNVMQSYGGRIGDDAGANAAIKSEETRAYLTWLKNAWDQGIFPPGNTTWDGAGDNQAYLSGQAAFIANTGSVGIAAKTDDPDLYDGTLYSPLPGGPKGIISPVNPNVRSISASSQNQETAKALLEYLSNPDFMTQYFAVAIYGPVLKNQASLTPFNGEDPILAGLLGLANSGTAPAYPDVYNTAYGEISSNFIIPKMAQRVVVDGYDFDKAMDEAQTAAQAIYDKYK